MNRISLRMKLIIGGVLASILPLIIVGYLSLYKASGALISSAQSQCMQVATDLAMLTESIMQKNETFARTTAHTREVVNAVQRVNEFGEAQAGEELEDLKSLLVTFLDRSNGEYENIFVLDKKGAIISDSVGAKDKVGSLGSRLYFKQAIKGNVSLSAPLFSPATGKRGVLLAHPIKNDSGTVTGVLVLSVNLEDLSDIIAGVKLGKTGIPFMISKTGLTIAHPDTQKILKSNPMEFDGMKTFAKRMIAQDKGFEVYTQNGVKKIVGFAPVKATGWSVGFTQTESEFMAPVTSIRHLIIYVAMGSLLVLVGAVLWFVKGVMRQLGGEPEEIAKIADSISDGDLTLTFSKNGKPLTGVYAAMEKMSRNLSTLLNQISGGVEMLSSSSAELSSISGEMTQSAEQTSDNANTVASAAEEMTANMNGVASASEQASASIQMIIAAAEEMSSTISEISMNTAKGSKTTLEAVTKAEEVSTKVTALGQAASQINKVTETISDISEQTNLLALNATIEAARAGEAGKGFAVVAAEIKALADQTAEATSEISVRIDDVQATTQDSVIAIENIVAVIHDVNEIVTSVAAAIEEQAATTQEITKNVSQAGLGVQEVNENVSQASTVAGEVSREVLLVSEASEQIKSGSIQVNGKSAELSKLAEKLNQITAMFTLK